MTLSRVVALGAVGLMVVFGTGCPSGVTEGNDDAGVDAPQADRPAQQDAPPFADDAAPSEGGAGDGPSTPDGGPCYPEPDETTGGDTCADALDRGTLAATTTSHVTLSGNLWPDGDVDWYKVAFTDNPAPANCGKFKARIAFTQNPGDHFRFDVQLDACNASATCQTVTAGDAGVPTDGGTPSTGLTAFQLDGAPACPCVAPGGPPSPTTDATHLCVDYSVTVRIKVFRAAGAPALCENYELSIDNG